jgi:hypothetical protein
LRLPEACVLPVKDRIARAVELALTEMMGMGAGGKDGPNSGKKEGMMAVTNLVSNYPSLFYQHFADFLPICFKGLLSPAPLVRSKASSAVAAFATAKINWLAERLAVAMEDRGATSRDAWVKAKAVAVKSEFFVVAHLKSALKLPGKTGPSYTSAGEKRTEWTQLESEFKEKVGKNESVHWACATWASVVTLIGSAYNSSTLTASFDHIMDVSAFRIWRALLTYLSVHCSPLPTPFGPHSHSQLGIMPFTPTSPRA